MPASQRSSAALVDFEHATWNLVARYDTDFTFEATEVHGGVAQRARFRCQAAFRCEDEHELSFTDGILLDEPAFRVRCVLLDHGTPCLGFALEEKQHVNVWKSRLAALGWPTGPWLRELKHAVLTIEPDATPFRVWWKAHGVMHEELLPLGELKRRLLEIVPGQKIAYVTDVVYHDDNAARVAALAGGADFLFIESPFLDADAERAAHHSFPRDKVCAGWITPAVIESLELDCADYVCRKIC